LKIRLRAQYGGIKGNLRGKKGEGLTDNLKLKETVLNYLKEHYTMTIATAKGESPWAATMFYANDGFTLYFLSDPTVAQHCKNIAGNPQVSVTIDEDYPLTKPDDWKKVRGIQMQGTAEVLTTEAEIAKATKVYVGKYPFVAPYLKLITAPFPKIISFLERFTRSLPFIPDFSATSLVKFYKVIPSAVWFVDNEKSFEHRQPVEF